MGCTEEHGGGKGRFHHVTYATNQREDILRAADIFLENDVFIETGPHKHAIQGTFFLTFSSRPEIGSNSPMPGRV